MSFTPLHPGELLRFDEEETPLRGLWFVYLVERSSYGVQPWEKKRNGRWQVLDLLTGAVSHLPEGHLLVYSSRARRPLLPAAARAGGRARADRPRGRP